MAVGLKALIPVSMHDHVSLQHAVSGGYIHFEDQHQKLINVKPCDVILDNQNELPAHISKHGHELNGITRSRKMKFGDPLR